MMKIIVVLLLILAGGWCAGYRVHLENLPYYLKFEDSSRKSEIKLMSGSVVSGTIEEDMETAVKLNSDGIITTYKKSEIESVKTGLPPDIPAMLRKNYDANNESHPLFTHRKEDSLGAKWDHAVLEPSRIAEEMKKNNSGLSATDQVNEALAESARIRQKAYQERKRMEEAAGESAG